MLFLFGVAGDILLSMSIDEYESFFGLNFKTYPNFLSLSYIWPYLYVTTPISNLVSWEGFSNFNCSFNSVYSALLPSVIRNEVFG